MVEASSGDSSPEEAAPRETTSHVSVSCVLSGSDKRFQVPSTVSIFVLVVDP